MGKICIALNPDLKGRDIPNFPMSCALLPDNLQVNRWGHNENIQVVWNHMGKHQNEEARARSIASVCYQ
jgi:hypothetical protein